MTNKYIWASLTGISAVGLTFGLFLCHKFGRRCSKISEREMKSVIEFLGSVGSLKKGEEVLLFGRLDHPQKINSQNVIFEVRSFPHLSGGVMLKEEPSFSRDVNNIKEVIRIRDDKSPEAYIDLNFDSVRGDAMGILTREDVIRDEMPSTFTSIANFINTITMNFMKIFCLPELGMVTGRFNQRFSLTVGTPFFAFVKISDVGRSGLLSTTSFIGTSLQDLLSFLQDSLVKSRVLVAISLFGFLLGSLKLHSHIKTSYLLKSIESAAKTKNKAVGMDQVLEENPTMLCTLCMDSARDIVLLPCGHCAMCYYCGVMYAENRGNQTCLICKTPFSDTVRIQYS